MSERTLNLLALLAATYSLASRRRAGSIRKAAPRIGTTKVAGR